MNWESPVRALTRGLALIEALNEDRVTSLARLHDLTGLPKPSLLRLLETLMAAGYVVQVSRRDGYALTGLALRLTSGVRRRDIVVDVAQPLLEAFTAEHKWQVSLSTGEGDSMLVRVSTRHLSPFSREKNFLNRRVPMLRSAVGRAYFAHCSAEEQALILDMRRGAADRLEADPDPAALARLVARVRIDGFATTERPRSDPTGSFAVPVLDPARTDSPLGAIGLFYYRSALTHAEAVRRYLPAMQALARRIGEDLVRTWGEEPARACGDETLLAVSWRGIGPETPSLPRPPDLGFQVWEPVTPAPAPEREAWRGRP